MKKEAETNDAVSPDGSASGHRRKAVYKRVDELTERLKRSLLDAVLTVLRDVSKRDMPSAV